MLLLLLLLLLHERGHDSQGSVTWLLFEQREPTAGRGKRYSFALPLSFFLSFLPARMDFIRNSMGMLAERLDSGPSAVRSIKMAVFRATSYTAAPPKPKHVDVSRESG